MNKKINPLLADPRFWIALGYKEKAEQFANQYRERLQLYESVKDLPPEDANRKIRLFNAQKFVDSLNGATTLGSYYAFIPSFQEYLKKYPRYKGTEVEYYAKVLPNEPPIGVEQAPGIEIIEHEGRAWAWLNQNTFIEVTEVLNGNS